MNLASIKQILRSKMLRKRLLIVGALLILFRLLAHVPVPVPDNAALANFLQRLFSSNQLLGFADLFSGGALTSFSIVMMGVAPYINASIIMQLMQQVIPQMEALSKEGEAGRQKINQYTRLLTVPLAILQSFGMVFLIQQASKSQLQIDLIGHPDLFQWVVMISAITGGSLLLMWIGEIITEQGIGNGISLLIFAGIVSRLPSQFGQFIQLAKTDSGTSLQLILFAVATVVVIAFVVLLNEGQRNVPVSYARRVRGSRVYGGVETHLPLKVILAGVIPIIFALAFLSVPGFLGQLFAKAHSAHIASIAQRASTLFSPTSMVYAVSYFALVVIFTYFYTSVVFNPDDIAENLQKQGGFIPGVRPGKETASYLRRVVNRITLAGAAGLGVIALLPFIAQRLTNRTLLTIGGTGLLIVVSVAIETMNQIQSQAVMTSYEKY